MYDEISHYYYNCCGKDKNAEFKCHEKYQQVDVTIVVF